MRDQGPEFDGEGNEEEQPVEQDDAVSVTKAGVLEPLDGKNDEKGDNRGRGGVDSEVAEPDVAVAGYLKGELDGKVGDDEAEEGLDAASEFRPHRLHKHDESHNPPA